jgi:hypothetical protein
MREEVLRKREEKCTPMRRLAKLKKMMKKNN